MNHNTGETPRNYFDRLRVASGAAVGRLIAQIYGAGSNGDYGTTRTYATGILYSPIGGLEKEHLALDASFAEENDYAWSSVMLSSDLIIVWREWLRRPVPATNFRNGRTGSPVYEIEHDIDHSVTYVQGLVESLIAGKDLDFKVLASKERAEIEQIVAKLSGSELNTDEKQKYLSYLSDMTFILREVERIYD